MPAPVRAVHADNGLLCGQLLRSHGAPGSTSSEESEEENDRSRSSASLLGPDASRVWRFLSCLTGPVSMHSDTIFLPVAPPRWCGLELTSEQRNKDMGSFQLPCSSPGGASISVSLKRALHLNVSSWSRVSPVASPHTHHSLHSVSQTEPHWQLEKPYLKSLHCQETSSKT